MIWIICTVITILLLVDRTIHVSSRKPLSPKPSTFAKRLCKVHQARMTMNYRFSADKKYFLKYAYLYVYVRKGRRNAESDCNILIRQVIWDFKDGVYDSEVLYRTAHLLETLFIGKSLNEYTLVCIPASSAYKHEKRFKSFCAELCNLTGLKNGFNRIEIRGERLQIHSSSDRNTPDWENCLWTNGHLWHGSKIILLDDVLTTGKTFGSFKAYLEGRGATVVCGVFLATVPEND